MKSTIATLLAASIFAGTVGAYVDRQMASTHEPAPINQMLSRSGR